MNKKFWSTIISSTNGDSTVATVDVPVFAVIVVAAVVFAVFVVAAAAATTAAATTTAAVGDG